MAYSSRGRRPAKPLKPLDPATLDAIAIRYVERFQTTQARVVRLLRQKIRERGWVEDGPPPDPEAVARRLVELGYVNDSAFAEARTRGLVRRGMGAGRVKASLSAYGVGQAEAERALDGHDALQAAIEFARRKRLGPYGPPLTDPKVRNRQFAAFARAGHPPALAQAILRARSEEELPDGDD